MATAEQIAQGILERVNKSKQPNFSVWRIGLTHNVEKRYGEWGEPQHFLYWEADSLEDAQAVESHFINKMGMEGGTGGDLDNWKTIYVYIF